MVTLEKFSDGTKELVVAKVDLCVLVIVGTTEVVKKVDIDVSTVLFKNTVLSSRGVDESNVGELVTKPLVTNDDVIFSTEVLFGTRTTKLDVGEIENVFTNVADKIDDELIV